MISTRQLKREDEGAFFSLIEKTEDSLSDKTWWLPIRQTAKQHFFDEQWCYILGLFDDDKLIGASCLFLNEFEYKDSARECDVPLDHTAEIGRCMVLPQYRGHNYLFEINKQLLSVAREKDLRRIILTIHPKNAASLASFKKLDAVFLKDIVKYEDYPRKVFLIEL